VAVHALTPEHNCVALVDCVIGGELQRRVPMAQVCEDCGEVHHPRYAPLDGARYRIGERWLCSTCMQKRSGPR